MIGLTARQAEVFDFVRGRIDADGCSPSLDEIAGHFGFASRRAALDHLLALSRKGFVEMDIRKHRSVRIVGGKNPSCEFAPLAASLPPGQARVYEFIHSRASGGGYPPTVREIGLRFDIKSPNGVACHLVALEKKGLIRRVKGRARGIVLVGDAGG